MNAKRISSVIVVLAILVSFSAFSPVLAKSPAAELKISGVDFVGLDNEVTHIHVISEGSLVGVTLGNGKTDYPMSVTNAVGDFDIYTEQIPAGAQGAVALGQTTAIFSSNGQAILKSGNMIVDVFDIAVNTANDPNAMPCNVLAPDGTTQVAVYVGFVDPKSGLSCQGDGSWGDSVPTITATAEASQTQTKVGKKNAAKVVFPAIVWRNGVANKDTRYDVVFDPAQSGSGDLLAKGWWYQPNLPAPKDREAFEVAIILQPGTYRFLGPQCRAWFNNDGQHPFDQGNLVINKQNVENFNAAATAGHGTESWVFIRCDAGEASGFSFARK